MDQSVMGIVHFRTQKEDRFAGGDTQGFRQLFPRIGDINIGIVGTADMDIILIFQQLVERPVKAFIQQKGKSGTGEVIIFADNGHAVCHTDPLNTDDRLSGEQITFRNVQLAGLHNFAHGHITAGRHGTETARFGKTDRVGNLPNDLFILDKCPLPLFLGQNPFFCQILDRPPDCDPAYAICFNQLCFRGNFLSGLIDSVFDLFL